MKPLVFVLGCQRSGTTWLANILDASPSTRSFMEPFARPIGLLSEFPDSSVFFESDAVGELGDWLRRELPRRLDHYKTFRFAKSAHDPFWFRLDRWAAKCADRVARFGMPRLLRDAQGFELLNMNRIHAPHPAVKDSDPSTWVVKELRLAGKLPVLRAAFPDARYVTVMRHPCATVHSMLEWFGRGRLTELREDIDTWVERFATQRASDRYRDVLGRCTSDSLAERLALYWRVSYETIERELDGDAAHRLVVYEDFAQDPAAGARGLVEWLGLEFEGGVADYVARSSSARSPTQTTNPLDTSRDSAAHAASWRAKIDPDVQERVMRIVGDSPLMARFGEEPSEPDTLAAAGDREARVVDACADPGVP